MDQKQAQDIIKNTFENTFDKTRFTNFIKNLLNRIDEARLFIYQGQLVPDAYKQYITALERIGKFGDDQNSIDILIVKLKKETSLERARTMQRNFIARYLNGSRGGEMKDAALVAFVSPDKEDWRFSLVKMEYKFEQTVSGKIKVKEEFTPARRWSFLVGKNERSHTAQTRLVNILKNDEQDPKLEEITKAFDIETVTKEFFFEYRGLFLYTKDELDKIVTQASSLRNEFESKGVDTVNFAKKLLGQIVFLYFLQKKGWFGVGRDDDWGTGSKHFLRELFERKHANYDNFFNDILEPLFYEALRMDRSHDDDYYSRFDCKIPFLNGGLFDPIGNYDWVHTDIIIPDKLFSNNIKTKEGDDGTGILDVFDRYNFTVKEDEPLEKEVAIDPELLGKAYEKFNAIRPDNYAEFKKALKSGKRGEENKFNKKFGVYYTPREIVHYMCQQSLINYLYTVTQASSLSKHNQDACDTTSSLSPHENIYYDISEAIAIRQRTLPHWEQDGKAYFVTFRLYDSIPEDVVENIRQERKKWFERNKIADASEVEKLSRENQIEYYRLFSKRYDELLDNGHGSCVLANPDCKKIVEEALNHFNDKRYYLDKYVVMPNHVHVIVIPMKSWSLEKILHSWKSFTANAINKSLNRKGELWMHESFDHIVRSPEQLERIRKYIEENPKVVQASIVTQASSLKEKDEEEHKQDACVTITKEDIEALIHTGEQVSENEARVLSKGKETKTYSHKLPESIRKNAALIDNKLADITVCDPAVGSGAFPVGMMSEIVKVRNVLTDFTVAQASSLRSLKNHKQDACDTDQRTTYDFKRRCIEHSLYGVDIDPGAVEIAKLRLWLSLVVDEDDIKNIKPLPNLDYRIMQGNSLISEFMGINFDSNKAKSTENLIFKDETNELIEQFQKKKDEFLNEANVSRKSILKKEVDDLLIKIFESKLKAEKQDYFSELKGIVNKNAELPDETQRNEYIKRDKEKLCKEFGFDLEATEKQLKEFTSGNKIKPFFLWNIYFSEVFHKKGGFDVVIGNPPYVKEYTNKKAFDGLRNSHYYLGKMDIWYLFACNSIDLLKSNAGILTFIAQNNWVTSYGASKMRNKVIKDTRIINLVDFCDYKIFESADIQTMIMIFQRDSKSDNYFFDYRRLTEKDANFEDMLNLLNKETTSKSEFLKPFIQRKKFFDKTLTFSHSDNEKILNKILQQSNFKLTENEVANGIHHHHDRVNKNMQKLLGDKFNIGDGIFVLSEKEKDRTPFTKEELELIKPSYTTKELSRYYANKHNSEWVIYTDSRFKHPKNIKPYLNIKAHLNKFKKVITSDNKPYGLHRARDEYFFKGKKIIAVRKCKEPTFTYTDFDCYVSATFYIIKSERINLKYLTSLLNSKLIAFWLKHKGKMQGNNYQIDKEPLLALPLNVRSNNEQKSLIEIVDRIFSITKSEDYLQTSQKQSNVESLEAEIDHLVYNLYDLTPEEIKIVEGEK